MLVAQVTDLHLGFDPDSPDEYNRLRLDRTLATLATMTPLPDLLLVTGDIADNGDDRVSYGRFKDAISDLPFPVWPAMGNHDSREAFLEAFPETPVEGGYIHYSIDDFPVRILVLDTLELGRHGGGFDEARAAWLEARLAEAPGRPTLIALHHPPIATGLSWMTENPDADWVVRLKPIVEANPNIVAMIAGHLHRPMVTRWAGTALAVCPSTAPLVALDMERLDPDHPDGRAMIVADRPWFALHYWNGQGLISHFDTVEDHEVLATYTDKRLPLLQMLAKERGRV